MKSRMAVDTFCRLGLHVQYTKIDAESVTTCMRNAVWGERLFSVFWWWAAFFVVVFVLTCDVGTDKT